MTVPAAIDRRPAGPAGFAIGGAIPREVAKPGTREEVAEVLKRANQVLQACTSLLQTQKSIDLHGLAEVEGAPCLRGLTEVELEALPRLGVD